MNWRRLAVAACATACAATAMAQQDAANVEAQLHDIYVNFYADPLEAGQWQDLVGDRANEVYNIHAGDNLWNISKLFFGDGNYWPKIWSVNRTISNPHLIEPGNSIRFILGDESDAPSFTITETADIEEKPHRHAYVDPDVEIPPPSQEFRPVLKRLPPSLIELGASSRKYNAAGISYNRLQRQKNDETTYLSAMISQSPPRALGRVLEVENADAAAGAQQYVYIEAPKNSLQPGQKFTIVRDLGKLARSVDGLERMGLETVIEFQGEVQIAERIQHAHTRSPLDMYRGFVSRAITPVTAGGVLVQQPLVAYNASRSGPRSSLVAQIIGGAAADGISFHGERMVLFINRGSGDGVAQGQILPVRLNTQLRNPDSHALVTLAPIGYLKIVEVTRAFATGVVLSQTQEIRTGDYTGQGDLHPAVSRASGPRTQNIVAY
jgi:hypothetical protein